MPVYVRRCLLADEHKAALCIYYIAPDIVTVTAIMGYKILPEALSPKKRRAAVVLSGARAFCNGGVEK